MTKMELMVVVAVERWFDSPNLKVLVLTLAFDLETTDIIVYHHRINDFSDAISLS